MVTFAQAQERAERWVNGDVPAYLHREVQVREFDLGFVAWAEDRAGDPSSDGGRTRLVIARDSGETTLWPGLPVGEVIRRYEEEYGVVDEAAPVADAPPRRLDLNATSFLLSPPQWLQDAADAMGIPDRKPEAAAAAAPEVAEVVAEPGPVAEERGDEAGVGLPATVLAPALSGSDEDDVPPPGVRPDARTELMPRGSALPPTAIAPAIEERKEPEASAGQQVPGVPVPSARRGDEGGAHPVDPGPSNGPEAPGGSGGQGGAYAATVLASPGGLGVPVPPGPPGPPGVPGVGRRGGEGGVPVPPGPPGVPGAGRPSAPEAPGGSGAQGGAYAATVLASPGGPGVPVPPGPPGVPGAGRPSAPEAPGGSGAQGGATPPAPTPPAPQGVHAAATVLAGPDAPGAPGLPPGPGAPVPPGAPGPGGYGYPQVPAGVPTVGPGYMAVLRYRAPDGSEQQIIRRSALGTPHPEWQILHELRTMNVPPQQVLELHTELESCDLPGGYCARMVRDAWPQVRVTHTAAYGRDHASRQQGVRHLVEHQGELHQVAGAPARSAPNRVPLPQPDQVTAAPPIAPDGIARELLDSYGPQGVFRFDQRAVSRQGVPEVVAQTLVWAGLPRDFGPFFWAQAQPDRPVPTLAELAVERGVRPAVDAGSYLVMGNDFGRQLCVQYGTAHMVAVPLEAASDGQPVPPQFVNTSLPQFVRSLALLGRMWRWRYGLTPEQAGRWTVDFQDQLASLDPAALAAPENWWAVLLEQMWDGLF